MQNGFPGQRPAYDDSGEINIRGQQQPISTHRAFSTFTRPEPQTDQVSAQKSAKFLGFLDGVITFCLGALFFGVPLFFTGLTFQGLAFEKQIFFYALLLIMLVAWVSKGVISGEMKIRRTPLDIPLLAFLVAYAISTFFSVDKWHSFWGFFGDPSRGLMSVIALIIAYYVIVSHYSSKRLIAMLWAIVASNFILVLWAFLQIMGVKIAAGSWGTYVPASMIGSLSGLGIFLGMMLPIIVTLVLHLKSEKSKVHGPLGIVALTFLFLTLLLDAVVLLILFSFVSWLGVLIGVSVFLVFVLAQIVRPSQNWTWVPMVMFVAILAILMIGNNTIARVSLPVEISPSYSLSWDIAKESLKHAFLVGSGPATYGYDFSLYHTQAFNLEQLYNLRFYQATGMFFEGVSTIGALGTITLLLLALTFIGAGAYMLGTNKAKNKLYSLGMFSAATIVLINSFSGRMEGSMVIVGVLLGALAMATLLFESEPEERFLSLSLKASPKYALALAFIFMVVSAGVVFLIVFVGKVFIADLQAGSGVRETTITENGSIAKIAGAVGWYNREGRYFTRLGQEYLVLANQEALKPQAQQNTSLISSYLQSAIMLAKQGRDMMPTDALAQETLAQTYENAGLYIPDSLAMAEDAYNAALQLEPHNPSYMIKIGQLKIAEGSQKNTPDDVKAGANAAKPWFQKAIDEKPNLADAYYQMSFDQELLSDNDGAITSMEKALQNDNSNVSYVFNLARLHQIRGNSDDLKIAQSLYQTILQANDKDVNTHFSLGLLYEKMKQPSDATNEYKKVLTLLTPSDSATATQVQKMIDNVSKGIVNTPDNINPPAATGSAQTQPAPAAQSAAPVVPAPTADTQAATPPAPLGQ